MIEKVVHRETLYALIIRENFREEGIKFFTPQDFSQQYRASDAKLELL